MDYDSWNPARNAALYPHNYDRGSLGRKKLLKARLQREAGSDFFVMPSRYEPCGLNQMYSLRYGTLPVVRRTGGPADTVVDASRGKAGNGFLFDKADSGELGRAIERAAAFYGDRRAMRRVRRRAMALRFEWFSAASEYEKVYQSCALTL